MDTTNVPGNFPVENVADFDLIDSINETDIEQFIELLREDNADPIVEFYPNYDSENIVGSFDDHCLFDVPAHENFFDFNVADTDYQENGEEQSSATTRKEAAATSTTTKKSTKPDRPRVIISERKRRGRMKEKLYALRALVPNITKMDKASIIGDAVLYVQDLQMQAEKLKTEIASLESSQTETSRHEQHVNGMSFTYNHPVIKKIMQIDVFQLEEGGFCVRLVCKKGLGVVASLYRALESLSNFNIKSSNLATTSEDYVLTFTVNVKECNVDMDLPNLKFWIASAFLNQGFDFETTVSV